MTRKRITAAVIVPWRSPDSSAVAARPGGPWRGARLRHGGRADERLGLAERALLAEAGHGRGLDRFARLIALRPAPRVRALLYEVRGAKRAILARAAAADDPR